MEPETPFQLFGRIDGPLHFRLILQPLMAAIFGYLDGIKDAKAGAPPYFWALKKVGIDERKAMIRQGWESIGKVFILAFSLDCVFQYIVYKSIGFVLAFLIASILAILPYLILRGIVNRMNSRRKT